jgi:Helix-turn-helix domain
MLWSILNDPGMTRGDAAVAMYLWDRFDEKKGGAWPSHETLAEVTSQSPRNAHRATERLVTKGYFEVRSGGGRGRSNLYIPILKTLTSASENEAETMTSVSENEAETMTSVSENYDTDVQKTMTPVAEDSTLETPPYDPTIGGLRAPPSPRRKRVPPDWLPDDKDRGFARQHCRDDRWIDREAAHCLNWHVGKGNVFADLHAMWRTWVLKADEIEKRDNVVRLPRQQTGGDPGSRVKSEVDRVVIGDRDGGTR